MSIDDQDYRAGFEEGFRAIAGKSRSLPSVPSQPSTPSRSTPFRVGLVKGMIKAGATITKSDGTVATK